MGVIDYNRRTLKLESLSAEQRSLEIQQFSRQIRVFHYATRGERIEPHGGGLSVKMVVSGAEWFMWGTNRMRLRVGEVLLMPPGVEYGSEIAEPTETFSAFFPPRLGLRLVGEARGDAFTEVEARSFSSAEPMPIAADAQVRGMMREARLNLEAHQHDRAEELLQHAAERLLLTTHEMNLAEERLGRIRAPQRRELLKRLQRARAYLHDHTGGQVGLDRLAEVSQLSRFHLLRSFQQAFGKTPAQYHHELRLQRAAQLLKGNQLSVSDVARASGYTTHSAFSRAWKRRFGHSPSASPA
jgi:AraC-like DNA-binding protein